MPSPETSCRAPAISWTACTTNTSGRYWSYPFDELCSAPRFCLGCRSATGKLPFAPQPVCFITAQGSRYRVSDRRRSFTRRWCTMGRSPVCRAWDLRRRFFHPRPVLSSSPTIPSQRLYSVNFSVQRQIGFQTVMQVAYVGNFDRHAPEGGFTNGGTNLNVVPYQAYANPANVFNGVKSTRISCAARTRAWERWVTRPTTCLT